MRAALGMVASVLVACGSNEGAGTGAASSSGAGEPEPGATRLEASIGPIQVQPGVENVQCITKRLGNAGSVFVRRFQTTLGEGSHHMIVYRTAATEERTTPYDCQSFAGLLGGTHPIFIAQQAASELQFPEDDQGNDVGLELDANQMITIEMHYINTAPTPLDVEGTVDIDVLPATSRVTKSDIAFWGTGDIDIPPNGEYDTGVMYQPALAGTKSFALTTHQHRLGTAMKVWYASSATDLGTQVADGENWQDPPLELFAPPLDFPNGGADTGSGKGFAYQCHWKNTTASHVGFGEGFNDEMCFLWHYYFPSRGFQICFHGKGCAVGSGSAD